MIFLVFVGGILVILIYLGMYGKYYKISYLGRIFIWMLLVIIPLNFEKEVFVFSTGERRMTIKKVYFLGILAVFLYFVLKGMSKILGVGSAMRSFMDKS